MVKEKILIIEDDPTLNEMLRFMLTRHQYECFQAHDTQSADRQMAGQIPDLILLDWMLPGITGVSYAEKLRQHPLTRDIPIIMLTAKSEEEDKVRGLNSGADDYVTKPFSNNELIARIGAAIRRSKPQKAGETVQSGAIRIDPVSHSLTISEQIVDIGTKEFQLLYLFIRNPSRVYSREQLLDQVWGKDSYVDERTVDVYIRRLRLVLEKHGRGKMIKTVRGVGYRFSPDETK